MTQLTQQKHDWDCGIACMAMMTGRPYSKVLAESPHEYMMQYGMSDGMVVDVLKRLGFFNIVLARRLVPCLPGEPLMMALPSKNIVSKMHYVYWDGDKLLDPQTGRPGKKFYSEEDIPGSYSLRSGGMTPGNCEIIGLWVNERLSTRNGRDL